MEITLAPSAVDALFWLQLKLSAITLSCSFCITLFATGVGAVAALLKR
ncbi:MAG TPA: hypothetical protein V6C86_24215 [Oculatellaceae cyanobacterium]